MADFCGRCLVDEGMPCLDADLFNDMRGGDGPLFGLCEGCGHHIFDRYGWPICAAETSSWYTDQDQNFLGPCKVCWPDEEVENGEVIQFRDERRAVADTILCDSCFYRTAMLGDLRVHVHTREVDCRPQDVP